MFHFKQFSVEDDSSSMKVGTDGVLLGITANTSNTKKILDVGTGCGVVALILAQKSNAHIDAIDIDIDSCQQAQENFSNSKWSKNLNVINADFSSFYKSNQSHYDLIVSNPPFFISGKRKECLRKSRARHIDSLSFSELCAGVSKLLNEHGLFFVILPDNTFSTFLVSANASGLFLCNILLVHPTVKRKPNRYIACFSKHHMEQISFDRLFIRENHLHYTKEFKELVKDFYLDFPY